MQLKQKRRLQVFLCHSSADKPAVRDLSDRLVAHDIDVWLDEDRLQPGHDWQREIRAAVRNSDVVLVCLSKSATNKEGFVQKEIKFALDVADEKPEGTIFLVPVKLEACDVPERLRRWQWVDDFDPSGFGKLLSALRMRSKHLGLKRLPGSATTRNMTSGARSKTATNIDPKIDVLRASGILEEVRTAYRYESVVGLESLKTWLRARQQALAAVARLKLPIPRGIALFGPPGCGKGLITMATANEWGVPLFKWDFRKVFRRLVGESEENVRRGLVVAQERAPCILWIDELELSLAAAGRDRPLESTLIRMLGMLITWLDEANRVFIIATANDFSRVPPELLRPGRLDQVFFVDLPTAEERARILANAIARLDQDPTRFDLGRYAEAAEGFSGSELVQAVHSAGFEALSAGPDSVLEDRHFVEAISAIKPVSTVMGDVIEESRRRRERFGWSRA